MQPTKCLACGGSSFEHDQWTSALAPFPQKIASNFKDVDVKASICLACGCVSIHVDEETLEKLRNRNPGWKDKEAKE